MGMTTISRDVSLHQVIAVSGTAKEWVSASFYANSVDVLLRGLTRPFLRPTHNENQQDRALRQNDGLTP